MVDSGGLIVLANHQAELLFGYPREALIGKPIELLVPEQFRDRHVGLRHDYGAHPVVRIMSHDIELSARRNDGSVIPVEISLSPMATRDGPCVHKGRVRQYEYSHRQTATRRMADALVCDICDVHVHCRHLSIWPRYQSAAAEGQRGHSLLYWIIESGSVVEELLTSPRFA